MFSNTMHLIWVTLGYLAKRVWWRYIDRPSAVFEKHTLSFQFHIHALFVSIKKKKKNLIKDIKVCVCKVTKCRNISARYCIDNSFSFLNTFKVFLMDSSLICLRMKTLGFCVVTWLHVCRLLWALKSKPQSILLLLERLPPQQRPNLKTQLR